MKRYFLYSLWLLALPLHAAEEDPTQKLREQLRSTLLQLRKVQTESANNQALAAQAEQKNQDLTTKLEELEKRNAALIKQSAADKAGSDQTVATLNNKVSEREKRITEYQEALEKWKTGYQTAAALARTKEEDRSKLSQENIVLKRNVEDLQRKNIALFNISNEILTRFEKYALGKALAAREPFISTTRVKVENLVQGYKDQILDQRISAAKP